MASHGQWIFWPSHPKNSQNHPGLVKANMKYHWSKEIWPPSSKLTQNRGGVSWPQKGSGFCGLAAQNTAKSSQNRLKANLKDQWSKEIWPPSSKECNPSDHFMWSEVEREVNRHPHNTLASLRSKVSEEMADMDRKVVIRACKKFRSRIEAVVEASGDFIE